MQRRWLDAASRTVVSRYGHGSRQRALEPLQGQGIMAGWRGLELTKLSETLRRHPGVGVTRRRAQARAAPQRVCRRYWSSGGPKTSTAPAPLVLARCPVINRAPATPVA